MVTNYLIKKSGSVIEKLKTIKEVVGIAFYGSVGRGVADKHSDIDIVCFVRKIPDKKLRELTWNNIGAKILPNSDNIDTFEHGNTHFGIWYKPYKEMDKNMISLFDKKFGEWLEGDVNNFVAKTKIVWDPRGFQKKWKRKASKYPQFIKFKKIEHINACQTSLEGVLIGLRRKNYIYVEERVWFITNTLISLIYSLNNQYFSTTKLFFEDAKRFKVMPIGCVKKIRELSSLDNRGDLLKKIKILKTLLFEIMDIAAKQKKDLKPKRNKEWCENIVKEIEAEIKN